MTSDMPEFMDKVKTSFDNLTVAKEYLETSQSDIQWRNRFWKLTEDTVVLNTSCEVGGDIRSFVAGAGAASNKIADRYMDEMIDTSTILNRQEQMNDRIFRLIAKNQNIDPDSVRRTGVTREFVPAYMQYMQGDLCDRPERNPRPFDDDSD